MMLAKVERECNVESALMQVIELGRWLTKAAATGTAAAGRAADENNTRTAARAPIALRVLTNSPFANLISSPRDCPGDPRNESTPTRYAGAEERDEAACSLVPGAARQLEDPLLSIEPDESSYFVPLK